MWGVLDAHHSTTGTTFDPEAIKLGNEELENRLLRLLTPNSTSVSQSRPPSDPVVLLQVQQAMRNPVQVHVVEYVQAGLVCRKV